RDPTFLRSRSRRRVRAVGVGALRLVVRRVLRLLPPAARGLLGFGGRRLQVLLRLVFRGVIEGKGDDRRTATGCRAARRRIPVAGSGAGRRNRLARHAEGGTAADALRLEAGERIARAVRATAAGTQEPDHGRASWMPDPDRRPGLLLVVLVLVG